MATVAECALHLCVAERTFHSLVAKGVISRQAPGQYDLDTIRREYLTHLDQRAEEQKAKNGNEVFRSAKARLLKEQADHLERQNAEMRKRMLPRDDVQTAIRGAFDRVRQRALQIPDTAAPLLVGVQSVPEVQSVLTDVVYEALTDLANTRVAGIPAKTRS